MREFLQKFSEEIFECEVKVKYSIGLGTGLTNSFTDKTTFEEYLHSPKKSTGGILMIQNEFDLSDKDKIENKIKDVVSKNDIFLFCTIYFAQEKSEFDLGFENEKYVTNEMPQLRIHMKNKNEYSMFEWRNI